MNRKNVKRSKVNETQVQFNAIQTKRILKKQTTLRHNVNNNYVNTNSNNYVSNNTNNLVNNHDSYGTVNNNRTTVKRTQFRVVNKNTQILQGTQPPQMAASVAAPPPPHSTNGLGGGNSPVPPLLPPSISPSSHEVGVTALMQACQQGRGTSVRQILHKDPNSVRDRDRTGKTALHYCAENNALTCIDQLVNVDLSLVQTKDEDGYTPLHLATIAGNRAVLKYLLSKGADVHATDNERHTAVHWATVCGEVELLDILINNGANPETPDIHGAYPIHYAAQMCGPNSELGHDIRVGLLVLQKLLQRGVSVAVRDHDGRQPLLWAASAEVRPSHVYCPSGSADAILALVNAGADVGAEDKDGLTALHCAASRGHLDCLDVLITLCGADVDTFDSNGCTPLFYAVTLGHADCAELLLRHRANPDTQDRKGRTPSHCGAAKGQLETLKLLHRRGADLWKKNNKGDLPLHEACQSGRKDLVTWLLSLRPEAVNHANNDDRCPLHIAAINNNTEMCKVLMDHKSSVNPIMRNSRGQLLTPLDAAVARGNRMCAKYLQLHGGMPAAKITDKRALQIALQRALEAGPAGHTGATPSDLTSDDLGSSSASSTVPKTSGMTSRNDSEMQTDLQEFRDAQTFMSHVNIRELVLEEELAWQQNQKMLLAQNQNEIADKVSQTTQTNFEIDEEFSKKFMSVKAVQKELSKTETIIEEKPQTIDAETQYVEDSAIQEIADAMVVDENVVTDQIANKELKENILDANSSKIEAKHKSLSKSSSGESTETDQEDSVQSVVTVIEAKMTNKRDKWNIDDSNKDDDNGNDVDDDGCSSASEETLSGDNDELGYLAPEREMGDGASEDGEHIPLRDVDEVITNENIISNKLDTHDLRTVDIGDNEQVTPRLLKQSSEESSAEDELLMSASSSAEDEENKVHQKRKVYKDSKNKKHLQTTSKIYLKKSSLNKQLTGQKRLAGKTIVKSQHKDNKSYSQGKQHKHLILDKKKISVEDEANNLFNSSEERSYVLNLNSSGGHQIGLVRDAPHRLDSPGKDGTSEFYREGQAYKTRWKGDADSSDAEMDSDGQPVRRTRKKDGSKGGQASKKGQSKKIGKKKEKKKENYDKNGSDKDKDKNSSSKSNDSHSSSSNESSENDENGDADVKDGSEKEIKRDEKRKLGKKKVKEKDKVNEEEEERDKEAVMDKSDRISIKARILSGGPTKVESLSSSSSNKKKKEEPVTEMSITQAMQTTMRKYQLERRLFQQLLNLKRLQIRNPKAKESVLIKRMVDLSNKEGLPLGMKTYGGKYTFASYEKYLYDQLRFMQTSQGIKVPHFRPIDDVDKLSKALKRTQMKELPDTIEGAKDAQSCNHSTHRCHHAIHAYTGVPCAAFLGQYRRLLAKEKSTKVSLPSIGGLKGEGKNLTNIDPKKPLTFQLQPTSAPNDEEKSTDEGRDIISSARSAPEPQHSVNHSPLPPKELHSAPPNGRILPPMKKDSKAEETIQDKVEQSPEVLNDSVDSADSGRRTFHVLDESLSSKNQASKSQPSRLPDKKSNQPMTTKPTPALNGVAGTEKKINQPNVERKKVVAGDRDRKIIRNGKPVTIRPKNVPPIAAGRRAAPSKFEVTPSDPKVTKS